MKLNSREEKRLQELLAKKEQAEKEDKEFFKQVRKRKAEVLKTLEIEEVSPEYKKFWENLLSLYDQECTIENISKYIEWVKKSVKKPEQEVSPTVHINQ